MKSGFLNRFRYWFADGGARVRERSTRDLIAVDVRCKNSSGGTLIGGDASTGGDWVQIKWASYAEKDVYPIEKTASAANGPALGVVAEDQGTVADGAYCWVRVYGRHPYAKVDGTADLVAGDMLAAFSTAGVAKKWASGSQRIGRVMVAFTTDSVGSMAVMLHNPDNLAI
jgi:hypothetical protein